MNKNPEAAAPIKCSHNSISQTNGGITCPEPQVKELQIATIQFSFLFMSSYCLLKQYFTVMSSKDQYPPMAPNPCDHEFQVWG